MAVCVYQGNTDMYGLGIRLGFYLQWFGAFLAVLLVPRRHRHPDDDDPLKDEAVGLRFSNNVFAAATFLALLILIVGDVSSLQPVEIYIILLLTFGYTLQLIPIYLWRLLTRGDPWRDPTRWPILRLSNVESWLRILLVAAVASFQLWFWFVRVPKLSNLGCEQYGFLLARVRLNLPVMQVDHILLYFGVLLTCIYMFARGFYVTFISPPNKEELPDMSRALKRRINTLQNLSIVPGLTTAALVVVATELTIHWNHIQGVNTLSSAGQTIPFAIGAALFARIFYVYLFKDPDPSETHGNRRPISPAPDWHPPPGLAPPPQRPPARPIPGWHPPAPGAAPRPPPRPAPPHQFPGQAGPFPGRGRRPSGRNRP